MPSLKINKGTGILKKPQNLDFFRNIFDNN